MTTFVRTKKFYDRSVTAKLCRLLQTVDIHFKFGYLNTGTSSYDVRKEFFFKFYIAKMIWFNK